MLCGFAWYVRGSNAAEGPLVCFECECARACASHRVDTFPVPVSSLPPIRDGRTFVGVTGGRTGFVGLCRVLTREESARAGLRTAWLLGGKQLGTGRWLV